MGLPPRTKRRVNFLEVRSILIGKLTDEDVVGGGVGTDVGALTIGQDGLAALSDEGEGVGEAGSADGADETSESSERELHCDDRIVIVNENQMDLGQGYARPL